MNKLKNNLHEIIFKADTTVGKAFDLILITSIVLSVIAVLLDSVQKVHRSTISRILKSARKKIADALVNVKAIRIEGGSCTFTDKD